MLNRPELINSPYHTVSQSSYYGDSKNQQLLFNVLNKREIRHGYYVWDHQTGRI